MVNWFSGIKRSWFLKYVTLSHRAQSRGFYLILKSGVINAARCHIERSRDAFPYGMQLINKIEKLKQSKKSKKMLYCSSNTSREIGVFFRSNTTVFQNNFPPALAFISPLGYEDIGSIRAIIHILFS